MSRSYSIFRVVERSDSQKSSIIGDSTLFTFFGDESRSDCALKSLNGCLVRHRVYCRSKRLALATAHSTSSARSHRLSWDIMPLVSELLQCLPVCIFGLSPLIKVSPIPFHRSQLFFHIPDSSCLQLTLPQALGLSVWAETLYRLLSELFPVPFPSLHFKVSPTPRLPITSLRFFKRGVRVSLIQVPDTRFQFTKETKHGKNSRNYLRRNYPRAKQLRKLQKEKKTMTI